MVTMHQTDDHVYEYGPSSGFFIVRFCAGASALVRSQSIAVADTRHPHYMCSSFNVNPKIRLQR
jgi:hypothetical protein